MIFEKQILNLYRGMAFTRCDDNGTAFYFSAKDFEGLVAESFSFSSSMGHTLEGNIYYYDNFNDKKIVVFDHGFGGGHLSYMKEIELLCRHGYRVIAYDHTGCMKSGGINPNGMAQSLCDLNDCINAVKNDSRFASLEIMVIGHSWGGFSTLNISALHPEISKIVVFSGFVCVEMLVNAYFGGILKGYRKAIMDLERSSNPKFVNFNAIETLKNSNTKALLIYSDNDKLCSKQVHFDALESGLKGCENVKLILENNKGHNPNYTREAVALLDQYVAAKNKLIKQKKLVTDEQKKEFLASFDWDKMTEQDERVWGEILAHFDA